MSEAVEITLANGSIAIVDSEDEHLVTGYAWYEAKGRSTSYAACTTGTRAKKNRIQMHRLIIGARDDEIVDHVNGNGLDNRRSNLRIATNSQNLMNRGPSKINNSGFKGVSLCKATGRWKAEITVEGERTWLGRFETPEEAALAYDAKARVLFKEFAYLNFPSSRDCTCLGTGEITVSDGHGCIDFDECPRCSWFEPYTDDYPTADDAMEVPF